MNLNFPTRSNCFPLRSLPDVIISHITQFLAPKDLGNMLRVNRYFRRLFSAPYFWREITVIVCLSKTEGKSKKIEPWILQGIKSRGITELVIQNSKCDKENDVIEVILRSLGSQLERISFAFTGLSIFPILRKAAVAGNWKLKKIDLRDIHWMTSYEQFTGVLQQLPGLEEIILGYNLGGVRPSLRSTFSPGGRAFELKLGMDLLRGLNCFAAKLTSISLIHVALVEAHFKALISNPNIQVLTLASIYIASRGIQDNQETKSVGCPSLTSLEVTDCPLVVTETLLSWIFPGSAHNETLTSLNVTRCHVSSFFTILPRLPALTKLNLTGTRLPGNLSEVVHILTKLEWVDLNGSTRIRGEELGELSKFVGKTLRYLGLAGLSVTDAQLRNVAPMFPALRTLDLSGCTGISDALLVEWYIKHDEKQWPRLRKLILKNCENITQEVVKSTRLRTRNQLLIDM
ncbi:uncharacterized protein [Montipora capricornis]|uniref:uncharacterized protein n=2 Tax=Montipora TaxID=46703 RepID=UPI0035F10C13